MCPFCNELSSGFFCEELGQSSKQGFIQNLGAINHCFPLLCGVLWQLCVYRLLVDYEYSMVVCGSFYAYFDIFVFHQRSENLKKIGRVVTVSI